jgi:lipopolysaccharide transport system permease protein
VPLDPSKPSSLRRFDGATAKTPVGAFVREPIDLLLRHRSVLARVALSDIRSRYAGSTLGILWLGLYQLLLLATYAIVYIFVFKVRLKMFTSYEYVLHIFAGLIPFLGFSEALSSGVGSVTSNATLVKNTVFPVDLIPAKTVIASQASQLVGTLILFVALAIIGKLSATALLFPVLYALQLAFLLGIVWTLSSINVFLRDLQSLVPLALLVLMLVSPIAYTPEMLPPALKPFLQINPLFHFLTAYQRVLVHGQWPTPTEFGTIIGIAAISFFGGYAIFRQLKQVFVDNV